MKQSGILRAALLFAFIAFAACASAEEKYINYFNEKLGYSVEYPDIFISKTVPENGDGMELKSKGGKYGLVIWGGYNVLESDGESLLKDRLDAVAHIAPGYPKSDKEFYAIEYGDSTLFYEYCTVSPEMQAGFILSYPKEEAAKFSKIKQKMEGSLVLPQE